MSLRTEAWIDVFVGLLFYAIGLGEAAVTVSFSGEAALALWVGSVVMQILAVVIWYGAFAAFLVLRESRHDGD